GTRTGPRAAGGGEDPVRSGRVGSFLVIFGADYTRELHRIATRESRLKIPLLFGLDVIHGFRTIYPIPLAEAASFDSARVESSARQAAVEATAHGVTWTFAPMVDIARDPRWGSIAEGAGEEPYLGGAIASARVRGLLRGRWGFKGVVISDWGGIGELIHHGVAANKGEAGILGIRAGVDIDMSDAVYADSLAAAVHTGRVTIAAVDSAVKRVLRLKYALGLFDDPYRFSDAAREKRYTLAPEHMGASLMAAREGIVLLKNANRTLPLRKDLHSVAIIGPLADDAQSALGNWAADGRRGEAISVLAGIGSALGASARIINVRGAPV